VIPSAPLSITLANRTVGYRVISSRAARRLTVRVGPAGVEVIQPIRRRSPDVVPFLAAHATWIVRQLDRIARRQANFPPIPLASGEILLRGVPIPAPLASAPALERWLRRQARVEIDRVLAPIAAQLHVTPCRVFIRGQRTLWGSCSSRGNLSFNWRCIMAPDHVLHYLVTHEAVHLLIPNHSRRFWLAVAELCPDLPTAKRWLTANAHHLMMDLAEVTAARRL
jgi:predicted metal-dependent hydrolase